MAINDHWPGGDSRNVLIYWGSMKNMISSYVWLLVELRLEFMPSSKGRGQWRNTQSHLT